MTYHIQEWRPGTVVDEDIDMLADVLHAVVHTGAGVSFIVPFSMDDARTFWSQTVLPDLRKETRRVVVARAGNRIVGTVQINLDTPPNQPHRADIEEMMVHPIARRHGIARALMTAVEEIARRERKTLLTLDTTTGGHAETLYRALGYLEVGVIPRYARSSLSPALDDCTIMYKELPGEGTQ